MKILITRTAPFKVFKNALMKASAQFPDAKIHVLIQKSEMSNLEIFGNNLVPVIVADGSFNLWREGIRFTREIRKERFDMIVLLYANARGMGYLNLDLMSFISGSKKEMIFDCDGRFYDVPSRLTKIIKSLLRLSTGCSLFGIIRSTIFLWETFLKTGTKKQNPVPEDTAGARKEKAPSNMVINRDQSRKKRIVFVDLMFTWPPHGGACVDLKEVASRLHDRGYKIDLIVPKFPGIFPRGNVDESLLPFNVHKVDFSAATFNPLFLPGRIRDRVDSLKPDYVYLGDSYFLKPYLIEALKKYKIIARFYTYESLCPNYYLFFKNGKRCDVNYLTHPTHCLKCAMGKMQYHIESLDMEVWSHEFIMSLAFLPSYHKRTINALSLCHTLITYNDLAAKMLSEFHPRVIPFPGGVNSADFIPGVGYNNGIKKIFVSGRLMDPRKGLKFFIETARRLRGQRQDFEVYLTHDQEYVEDYINSLGWMDHRELKNVFKEMDLCVVPSLWEEPFGMVAVEAMASGKPVVASDVAGLKMSVEDEVTGLLFPPGNESRLLESLNKLLDDPALMKKMGKAGRERAVKYFDWDRVVDRYCNEIFDGKE